MNRSDRFRAVGTLILSICTLISAYLVGPLRPVHDGGQVAAVPPATTTSTPMSIVASPSPPLTLSPTPFPTVPTSTPAPTLTATPATLKPDRAELFQLPKPLHYNPLEESQEGIRSMAAVLRARGFGRQNLVAEKVAQTPWRVGLISGHLNYDSGAVCEGEELILEADVVHHIAILTKGILSSRGITVDILDEFDARLFDYEADALISIHADMCDPHPILTGYKSAAAPNDHSRALKECIDVYYGEMTALAADSSIYHITSDMIKYHAFRKVEPDTPALILEVGYLHNDQALLVDGTRPARAIADGVICHLSGNGVN